MVAKHPITEEGHKKIQEELARLIKVEREALKEKIRLARELGDLKENAEYHSAKEQQALTEGRISHLQNIVANAQIINVSTVKSDKIVFGATVTLIDEENQIQTYKIVGKDESDIKEGKISYTSPIGKALIGRQEGDTILVDAPRGEIEYEVKSFFYK